MSAVILPGTAVGVLGSGQLGRMFAIAARRMGYRVHTYSPDADTPTGQVADVEINAPYEDLDQVRAFARGVRVITFEFENVPSATVEAARLEAPVRPGGHVLHTTQQRLREKSFLSGAGFPVTPFAAIRVETDLDTAAGTVGVPAILKSAAFGYDGKGQTRVLSRDDLRPAWERLGRQEAILEALVDFSLEVSVVAARGVDGSFAHYGVVENHHVNHVLDVSIAPARVPAAVAREAVELARAILERLDVVGVLCVEFFVTRAGSLLINELAPRPHNSGHFTFDACVTSQFEQQLRAVCGLPLGSTEQLRPAAMANLLGDRWARGEPRWSAACAFPNVKLHLYGKTEPRPGRKMGHLTALAATAEEAQQQVLAARAALEAGLHSTMLRGLLLLPLSLLGCASPPPARAATDAPSPPEVDAAMHHWSTAPQPTAARTLSAAAPSQIFRIAAPTQRSRRRSGRRVDVELHRATLPDALQLLANEARINLVLAEGISGEVSLSLRQVDPLEALETLASSRNLTLDHQGAITVIRKNLPTNHRAIFLHVTTLVSPLAAGRAARLLGFSGLLERRRCPGAGRQPRRLRPGHGQPGLPAPRAVPVQHRQRHPGPRRGRSVRGVRAGRAARDAARGRRVDL